MDVFLMIRRKKMTIFLDAKENTKVSDLKKMIEGITKKPPNEQRLYNKDEVLMENEKYLIDYGLSSSEAKAHTPAEVGLSFMSGGTFEELDKTPYSPLPELPQVMNPGSGIEERKNKPLKDVLKDHFKKTTKKDTTDSE